VDEQAAEAPDPSPWAATLATERREIVRRAPKIAGLRGWRRMTTTAE
jgi:hypothetical protein